ncbi:hypothetical protein [Nocardia donostiensis]|uniref:hypothetical protein n=1 Tax=Nocardia donostiensis TaxID=1538463 RepID=UPI001FE7A93F|nr:hypothetical protein [Nocardia donostiensis]
MTNPPDLPPSGSSEPQPERSEQPTQPERSAARGPGNWLLFLALGLFGVGLLAVIAIFLTPVLTDGKPGLWLYLLAMLSPLGFVMALIFALLSGRRVK